MSWPHGSTITSDAINWARNFGLLGVSAKCAQKIFEDWEVASWVDTIGIEFARSHTPSLASIDIGDKASANIGTQVGFLLEDAKDQSGSHTCLGTCQLGILKSGAEWDRPGIH